MTLCQNNNLANNLFMFFIKFYIMSNKTLQQLLDKIFDDDYKSLSTYLISNDVVFEHFDDEYNIELAVPGLSKEDLKILTTKDVITISNEKNDTSKFVKSFKKTYRLPKDSDITNISAKVENGICRIIIPKDKEKSGERLIEIS